VRLPVVLVALPVHFKRKGCDLLVRQVGIARIENFSAGQLLGTCSGNLPQPLLDVALLRIREAVAANPPGIEHAERRNRFEALVGLRRGQRVSASAADTEQTETRDIDARITGDEIRHAVNVLDAICGLVHTARLAAAAALIRGIRGDRDVALLG
jgi:hypothetical protein